MKNLIYLLAAFAIISGCARKSSSEFSLPSIISSGMVLQRNTQVNLFGKASPGENIGVVTSWGFRKTVKAGNDGKWLVPITTGDAGGPYQVAFQTKDTNVTLINVMIGEVWVCSGQSNMEMPLIGWPPNDTVMNSARTIASSENPQIRMFTVVKNIATEPLSDCSGEWVESNPETAVSFSATAYFFGKKLHEELNVPVGLIHTSWGGTPAESWTPEKFLKEVRGYENISDSLRIAFLQNDSLIRWVKTLPGDNIDINNRSFIEKIKNINLTYAGAGFVDTSWNEISVPSLWEGNQLPGFDGAVWMRCSFDLPAKMAGKNLKLSLGPIDDMDMTFMNGEKIGETMEPGNWKEDRNYDVPSSTLNEGKNVLAVCVFDFQGGGGIYGDQDITLSTARGEKITLQGNWKYLPIAEIRGGFFHYYSDEKPYSARPVISTPVNDHTPICLYNGMIHPIISYTIKGAIWYQGESNVGRGYEYRTLFPAMINGWREAWNQGNFPFYYVQIAPWDYGEDVPSSSAEIREAQLLSLNVPNTGMVVTTDIGNPVNIHPANKEEVGRRLALWALAKDYGMNSLVYSGPLYDSIAISGGSIRVYFTHAEGGLVNKGGPLTWFEIAGEDQQYYPAKATIDGETVIVNSDKVKEPVAVRFGWNMIAEPNLFNKAGLPASPFRSDNWKRLSEY